MSPIHGSLRTAGLSSQTDARGGGSGDITYIDTTHEAHANTDPFESASPSNQRSEELDIKNSCHGVAVMRIYIPEPPRESVFHCV